MKSTYNERKKIKYGIVNIPEADKTKVPEIIRSMKSSLVKENLSDATYEYFGKLFGLIELELSTKAMG